jgi:phasin family protein
LFERVSEQQLELVHASVDAGVKSARLVGETRSYQEFAAAQAALANEYGERVLQIVRKSNQVVGGLRDEYVSWMEGQVRQTVGPLAKPAATPGKKAA